MGPAVPGQKIRGSSRTHQPRGRRHRADRNRPDQQRRLGRAGVDAGAEPAGLNQTARRTLRCDSAGTGPSGAALLRARLDCGAALHDSRRRSVRTGRPPRPVLTARARYLVAGVPVAIRATVRRREAAPAVRRRAARVDGRPRGRRERGSTRGHRSDRSSTASRLGSQRQDRRGPRRAGRATCGTAIEWTADAAAAGRMDLDAPVVALRLRAAPASAAATASPSRCRRSTRATTGSRRSRRSAIVSIAKATTSSSTAISRRATSFIRRRFKCAGST